jgi:hypothetical protein
MLIILTAVLKPHGSNNISFLASSKSLENPQEALENLSNLCIALDKLFDTTAGRFGKTVKI